MFRRFKKVKQEFGVYWDKDLTIRCLYCKGKLSKRIASWIFACEKCGSEHPLRRDDGTKISKERATELMRRKQ